MKTQTKLLALLTLSLLAAGCGKKDEAPAPVADAASAPAASAPAGATADEWAWADSATRPGPTAAPAASGDSRDVEDSRPVATTPQPAPPRASAPKPRAPKEPTNEFEDAPYGDDKPAAPSAPAKVAYTAPAGAAFEAKLDAALSSETATVGQAITATLDADVTDGAGNVVLPRGTKISGTVTEALSAKKVKKKSALAYQFTSAQLPDGTTVAVSAGQRLEGKGYTKKDAAIIGGSAAGGAVLGQVLGGDTEATAAGAILGGAIGSGVAMSRKGEDVELEAGTLVSLKMERPVTIER